MSIVDVITGFDAQVAHALNVYAARPGTFNHLVVLLTGADVIKMAPFIAIVVWFWNRPPLSAHRHIVLRGMLGTLVAFVAGRILQVGLPPRLRPVHDAALGLKLPAFTSAETLGGWSSFPSDHAAIFAAAVCLAFALSRVLGVLTALHAFVLVMLPRLYVGVHYPTDIIAGCFVGVAGALAVLVGPLGVWIGTTGERLAVRYPAAFHTVAVFFLIQLAEMFHEAREYASVLKGLWLGKY
ncbi:MAG: phosphatase PAP2 family protein [Alphaproteobacteria bacterium]|nr:phosphatase PAP2 family protein [Alphaproteobacteria bacterium]